MRISMFGTWKLKCYEISMRLFLPVCTAVDHHLAKALQPLPNSGMRELYPVQVWLSAATFSHLCMSPQRAQIWVFHVVSWLRRISPHVSENLHLLFLQTLQCLGRPVLIGSISRVGSLLKRPHPFISHGTPGHNLFRIRAPWGSDARKAMDWVLC